MSLLGVIMVSIISSITGLVYSNWKVAHGFMKVSMDEETGECECTLCLDPSIDYSKKRKLVLTIKK